MKRKHKDTTRLTNKERTARLLDAIGQGRPYNPTTFKAIERAIQAAVRQALARAKLRAK